MSAYRSVGVYGGVEGADSQRLIQLLLDGAVGAIQTAGAHLERGDLPAKAREISRAVNIVDALRANLDHQSGGEIAGNLERLYDYLVRRLTLANASNDADAIQESAALLGQIRDAWSAIGGQAPADTLAAAR
jgi:flagellar protein FliS